jgi:hypothetical protein
MNGPDHYREAERLLDEATSRGDFNPKAQWCLELAKLQRLWPTSLQPPRPLTAGNGSGPPVPGSAI